MVLGMAADTGGKMVLGMAADTGGNSILKGYTMKGFRTHRPALDTIFYFDRFLLRQEQCAGSVELSWKSKHSTIFV
jgi:hypothetical protein